jgi:hypothetical protein
MPFLVALRSRFCHVETTDYPYPADHSKDPRLLSGSRLIGLIDFENTLSDVAGRSIRASPPALFET